MERAAPTKARLPELVLGLLDGLSRFGLRGRS
jgi:hypothetical protein